MLVTAPRVSRSCGHFPDRFHTLHRVSGLGIMRLIFGVRDYAFGSLVSGSCVRFSGLGMMHSGSWFRYYAFGFLVRGCSFGVSGLLVRGFSVSVSGLGSAISGVEG